jgi:hypothetical protein
MTVQFYSDEPEDVAHVTTFNGVVTPFEVEESLPWHWPHRKEIVERIVDHVNKVAAGCIHKHPSILSFFGGRDWEGSVVLLWN